jgi:hypothetical protein
MRGLPRPLRSARSAFELCVKSVGDPVLAARLKAVTSAIEGAELAYLDKAENATLFGVVGALMCPGDCTREMVALYSNILSKKGSNVRYVYDELRSAAKGDICPLCAQRTVSTLDHYLEKARFPVYAVAPINLVPACAECNKVRSYARPTGPSDQTLHPYFEDADDQVWLEAIVNETDPISVIYAVARPGTWTQLKQDRVQTHFKVLSLSSLYSSHAAAELTGARFWLMKLGQREGADGVRAHLFEQAESRRAASMNSWQGALYAALSASEWFCNGGYRFIPAT